jgi:hypothetical protein
MNTKTILLFAILLTAGLLAVSAKVNVFYHATLLDGGQPASGDYDLKFTLYENSSGGQPVGVAYTNTLVRITNGVVQCGLLCRNDDVRLKRGWIEAAIRPAGSEVEFTPMRARVDNCKAHAAGAGKSCDARCEFVTLRLHTLRLPFSFDPTQPHRGRGFLHLPKGIAGAVPPAGGPAR